jgi:hypothetical protein
MITNKKEYMQKLTFAQLLGKAIHSRGDVSLLTNLNKEFTRRAENDTARGKAPVVDGLGVLSGNELGRVKTLELIKKAQKRIAKEKGKVPDSEYIDYKALYLKVCSAKKRQGNKLNKQIDKAEASRQRLKNRNK